MSQETVQAIFQREMMPILEARNQCFADRNLKNPTRPFPKGMQCWCGHHRMQEST